MRILRALSMLSLIVPIIAPSAEELTKLRIRAILVTASLEQKPVPRMEVTLRTDVRTETIRVRTDFDGSAQVDILPGQYKLETPNGVQFGDQQFSWTLDVEVGSTGGSVDLSNDNARVEQLKREALPAGTERDLPTLFEKLQKTVFTVWSEIGHGTGFLVEDDLIITNEHVIGRSEHVAVQFDERTKVAAIKLAADAQKDVAVLWFDRTNIAESASATFAAHESKLTPGERIFTIGSPMSQRKVITSGLVSKVEERAIISDININPGNSGGPLFNTRGDVVGITTFGEQADAGPGISGIVRIKEAAAPLAEAKEKRSSAQKPSPELLPVEPTNAYPLDALKAAVTADKFDRRPYIFSAGDYEIAVLTPVYIYREEFESKLRASKEKERRNRKQAQAVQGTFQPMDELRKWAEYVGQYKPVTQILPKPRLSETFWSAFGRGMVAGAAAYSGTYATLPPAKMRFKTDFYKMTLKCGGKEIQPIQPLKIEQVIDVQNIAVNATDATYAGLYTYPADAISPDCGFVALNIYSERNPKLPTVRMIDARTVTRVWSDFAPYRTAATK